jgi:hypothetical protein
MSEEQKSEQADEHVEDLDVAESESKDVKGGGGTTERKAGKGQHEYLVVKLENVQITSY